LGRIMVVVLLLGIAAGEIVAERRAWQRIDAVAGVGGGMARRHAGAKRQDQAGAADEGGRGQAEAFSHTNTPWRAGSAGRRGKGRARRRGVWRQFTGRPPSLPLPPCYRQRELAHMFG